jgi:small subunit ribosomal protein S1
MDQLNAQNGQDTAAENNKEAETEELSMEALLETGELSLDLPKPGEVRKGVIASVSDDEVLVSIGAKSEGVIPARELSQLSVEDRADLQVGKEISVYVVSPESRGGTLMLSFTRAMEEDDWNNAQELMKSKTTFEGEIEGYNKGGLIIQMGRLRGFVPASQISLSRRMSYKGDTPEQRWGGMVGQPISVRVIEVDRQRRRLILSEKAAMKESRESLKERLLDELEVGEERKGRVTSLADFGAFVNINGADGLVHLSEISWERIEHPSEVLQVGQEVQVKVISVDRDRRRIGLSLRQMQHDPWEDMVADFQVGQLVEGEITRLTKFGAFAKLNENLEGLIHISEISEKRIEHPKEVLAVGDIVTLRVIKVDTARRRIGLSMRKVESMKYSDMDWEMVLAEIEENDEPEEEADTQVEEEPTPTDQAPEAEPEAKAAEAEPEAEAPEEEQAPDEEQS